MTTFRLYQFYRRGGRNRINAIKTAIKVAWRMQ